VQSDSSDKSPPEQASQVPLEACSVIKIIAAAGFRHGFEQVRAGKAPEFDAWGADFLWSYERGRLFAHIAPLSMPLWVKGTLNPKAVALYTAAGQRGYVL
jgi:hypothetical protein